MQTINKIIASPFEPDATNILWLDTSNGDAPVLRFCNNGGWKEVKSEDTPRPIVLTDMPTDESASLSALAAIGLTPAEVEAAARGKRYGVLIGTSYYCLSFQYYNSATDWAIGFYSISYNEKFELYGGEGCTIIVEGTNVTVKYGEM